MKHYFNSGYLFMVGEVYRQREIAALSNSEQTPASSAEIDENSLPRWNLSDLYSGPQSDELINDLQRAKELAETFVNSYRTKIVDIFADGSADSAKSVHEVIVEYENLMDLLGRIATYVFLYYCENTSDGARGRVYGDIRTQMAEIERTLLFVDLEINSVEPEIIDKIVAHEPLNRYRNWIADLRLEKPHQLDERTETLMYDKDLTGASAWVRLFEESVSELRFIVDGTELPIEPTLARLSSVNANDREQAAHALIDTFSANTKHFAKISNVLIQDKAINDRWRSFTSPSASRHLENRVEPAVVEAMVTAVQEAYSRLSHRYYQLKAQWFGVDALNFWDRNAPVSFADNQTYTFENARDIVLRAYGEFSPKMRQIGQRFFDEKWIDFPTMPGKAAGAFAHPCVPSSHPYILLNYQGKSRDVMTLAHELGHGVHQVLASDQGPLMASTPLTLAETASVFGEMLTFQSMLSQTTDQQARRALVINKVEDMLNTVTRQVAFYVFEQRMHSERAKGEISPERIGEIWLEVQRESLGSGVKLNEGYEAFWCYIPHFIHSPFYVYAYAFGDCLVNSLYARYRAGTSDFEQMYLALLASGGSQHYSTVLAPFGLDLRDPSFWAEGLDSISGYIEELVQTPS